MTTHSSSDQLLILTIDVGPDNIGGVPRLVETLTRFAHRWGRMPTVYRADLGAGLDRGERLRNILANPRPRIATHDDHTRIAAPPIPLPLPLAYLNPYFLIGPLVAGHDAVIAASGSAHVAAPLALRRAPYVLWIATLYEDEIRAKADSGDAWAEGVLRAPWWRLLAWQERIALRGAARILSLSAYTAERIKETLPDVADRVEIVPYPVDTDAFTPDPAARDESPYGRYVLLAARVNDPRKNVPMLLRAFARVRAEHPDLSLVLTGEAPNDDLSALVDELELGEHVVFTGKVTAEEIVRLHQGATLFALPSIQEGLGIVVLEAMACGVPVVTTASGGPEMLVVDGETGRIVPRSDDPDAFAAAMLDVLSNKDRLDIMREASVAHVRRNFSDVAIAAQIKAVVADARESGPRTSRWLEWVAAAWAVFIFAAYMQHQLSRHWPAIREQIIGPLMGGG